MAKEEKVEVEGIVIESMHGTYKVQVSDKLIVTARVSGKMLMHQIRILPGDKVTVEMSPKDLTHGIIKYRK